MTFQKAGINPEHCDPFDPLWPYTAGMVDGEGTVTMTIQNGYHRRIRIGVYQSGTDGKSLLDGLQVDTNLGRVVPRGGSHNLPAYEWRIDRQIECLSLLEKIKPFLRLKSKNAKLAIEILLDKQKRHSKITNPEQCWNRQKIWTQNEIEQLKQKYDAKPNTIDELCKLLNRTREGVHIKAWKLGLTTHRGNHRQPQTTDSAYLEIQGGHKLQKNKEVKFLQ